MGMGFLQLNTNTPKQNTFGVFQREPQLTSFRLPVRSHDDEEKYKRLKRQIEESRKVQANWDSYNAPAPTPQSIDATLPFIRVCYLEQLIPDDYGAMAEGGITVSFMKNGRYAAVEFYNSGEMVALLSRPVDSDVWEFSSNILEFQKVIRQIRHFLG
jgi:hypothetical protein